MTDASRPEHLTKISFGQLAAQIVLDPRTIAVALRGWICLLNDLGPAFSLAIGEGLLDRNLRPSAHPDWDVNADAEKCSMLSQELLKIRSAIVLAADISPIQWLTKESPLFDTIAAINTHLLNGDYRNVFFEFLPSLEGAITLIDGHMDFQEATRESQTTSITSGPKTEALPETVQTDSLKVSLNVLMADIYSKKMDECVSWSIREWQERLTEFWGRKPSTGAIYKTATWKLMLQLRDDAAIARVEKQSVVDETGKRRSTGY